MTNDAARPQTGGYTIADLAADAAEVGRVLHLGERSVELPEQAHVVVPDRDIPKGALALVAGLDSYGD